jgi:hypothetical protein
MTAVDGRQLPLSGLPRSRFEPFQRRSSDGRTRDNRTRVTLNRLADLFLLTPSFLDRVALASPLSIPCDNEMGVST